MADTIQHNISLKSLNTMALQVTAASYIQAHNKEAILQAIHYAGENALPICVLGGGSNVIFAGDYSGIVLHLASKGIELMEEADDSVLVRVAAGEMWDEFLQVCLMRKWYGLENLAIIPGTVGAAPIQNIGAYGQEVASCIENVHVITIEDLSERILSNADCQFAYRDSIFKNALYNKCIITAVDFRLKKAFTPDLEYKAIADLLSENTSPSAKEVRNAVIATRNSKLPSPQSLPNTGSFFKNPVVSYEKFQLLVDKYPEMPFFKHSTMEVKLAAGWLIEHSGWKGKYLGPVGMYEKQALVLVNRGEATYVDVKNLVNRVTEAVNSKFGVLLEQEPVMISSGNPAS